MPRTTSEADPLDGYNYTPQEEDAVRAFANLLGESVSYVAGGVFEEAWAGEWSSPEAYAEHLARSTGQLDESDWLHSFVDWEAVADSLHHDYDFIDSPGGVYVFRIL